MRKGNFFTSDESPDLFVGVRIKDGEPQVVFPHGFNISDDEKEQRKDVFRLLSVLQRFTDHKEGDKTDNNTDIKTSFPLSSYQYVIQDFLRNGYYVEKEIKYVQSLKGKINWKRTIQKEKPQLDGDNIVYLKFQVKTNQINRDKLITKIHQYCVYESLFKFGWMYLSSTYLPQKPILKYDKNLFTNILKQSLNNTFNDSKRKLFQSMINIINEDDDDIGVNNVSIGVNKFEGVWERLVDHVFGEENKQKYFPNAKWHIIKDATEANCSVLEPDTIMKHDGKIYVLDSKYYKYGITNFANDLPQTDSIQKQITYGKNIVTKFPQEVKENDVYNAFIMPFDSQGQEHYKFVSVGESSWEEYNDNTPNYAYVLGMLVDTKWLISEYVRHNDKEIDSLAKKIEESLIDFRKTHDISNTSKEQTTKTFEYHQAATFLQQEAAETPVIYGD